MIEINDTPVYESLNKLANNIHRVYLMDFAINYLSNKKKCTIVGFLSTILTDNIIRIKRSNAYKPSTPTTFAETLRN